MAGLTYLVERSWWGTQLHDEHQAGKSILVEQLSRVTVDGALMRVDGHEVELCCYEHADHLCGYDPSDPEARTVVDFHKYETPVLPQSLAGRVLASLSGASVGSRSVYLNLDDGDRYSIYCGGASVYNDLASVEVAEVTGDGKMTGGGRIRSFESYVVQKTADHGYSYWRLVLDDGRHVTMRWSENPDVPGSWGGCGPPFSLLRVKT